MHGRRNIRHSFVTAQWAGAIHPAQQTLRAQCIKALPLKARLRRVLSSRRLASRQPAQVQHPASVAV